MAVGRVLVVAVLERWPLPVERLKYERIYAFSARIIASSR